MRPLCYNYRYAEVSGVMAVYLVTGGCGFIGSHLCEALIVQGHYIRVLDDLSTGWIENLPRGVELLRGSVTDPELVNEAMAEVAGCFHLAAIASVERSTREWLVSHRTNLSGTIAVLDAARSVGDRRVPIVYASSAAVYGDCKQLPIRESNQVQPRSPYGADKYGSELHARIASELHGVPTIGLRLFNVYGPRQDPGSPYSGVISKFCDKLQNLEPIDVFGDGFQTRDFVFVTDVVTTMLAAMTRAEACSVASSAVYNVCSGKRTTVLELAQLIAELTDCDLKIRWQPPRPGEIAHSCGDRRLVAHSLGLSSPVDLRSGLRSTLSWMKEAEVVKLTRNLSTSA